MSSVVLIVLKVALETALLLLRRSGRLALAPALAAARGAAWAYDPSRAGAGRTLARVLAEASAVFAVAESVGTNGARAVAAIAAAVSAVSATVQSVRRGRGGDLESAARAVRRHNDARRYRSPGAR